MEKEYYIVEGDTRVGPLSIMQLSERGIEPSTLVWTAGMADWTWADRVPELANLLQPYTRNEQPGTPYGERAPYGAPANAYGQPRSVGPAPDPMRYPNTPTNWKTLAIVATVVGFLFSCIGGIVGIFAITNASKAQNAERYGDYVTAQNAWSTCKTLCIVSFVLSGIGLVVNILSIMNLFSVAQFLPGQL